MAKYQLYVLCRRGGLSVDSGLQDVCEAESDQEAVRKMIASALSLKSHYDEVICELHKDGVKVGREFSL